MNFSKCVKKNFVRHIYQLFCHGMLTSARSELAQNFHTSRSGHCQTWARSDNRLPWNFSTRVIHKDQLVSKPMWSGRFLHYHSHLPLNYKINVINNLVVKGITLAHKSFYNEEIQKIKSILLKNNYPHGALDCVCSHMGAWWGPAAPTFVDHWYIYSNCLTKSLKQLMTSMYLIKWRWGILLLSWRVLVWPQLSLKVSIYCNVALTRETYPYWKFELLKFENSFHIFHVLQQDENFN